MSGLSAWRHVDSLLPQARAYRLCELKRKRRIAVQANGIDVNVTDDSTLTDDGTGDHHR
jgi:hypothetical protein